jgi:hypothetical protein
MTCLLHLEYCPLPGLFSLAVAIWTELYKHTSVYTQGYVSVQLRKGRNILGMVG